MITETATTWDVNFWLTGTSNMTIGVWDGSWYVTYESMDDYFMTLYRNYRDASNVLVKQDVI